MTEQHPQGEDFLADVDVPVEAGRWKTCLNAAGNARLKRKRTTCGFFALRSSSQAPSCGFLAPPSQEVLNSPEQGGTRHQPRRFRRFHEEPG